MHPAIVYCLSEEDYQPFRAHQVEGIFKENLEREFDIRTMSVMFTEVHSIILALLRKTAMSQIKREPRHWIIHVLVVH